MGAVALGPFWPAARLAYFYNGHSLGWPATIAFVATLVVWIVWRLVRRRDRR